MTVNNHKPLFNVKAVVQETGIRPDTLRAWERRYGIPHPERTDSGHRLYSQHEVETVKWLMDRQREGMSISRAVALWEQLVESGEDPLTKNTDEDLQKADDEFARPTRVEMRDDLPNSLVGIRDEWVAACLSFDERTADQVLATAFAMFPIENVVKQVIQSGIAVIGEGWHAGRVTVQQEHFATGIAVRRIDTLLSAAPPPSRRGRILIGCPSGETHSFAALILTFLLRRKGWDVINLGADVPLQSLALTIETTEPTLVVMTAQQLHTAANLLEMADMAERADVALAYGGLIFGAIPDMLQVVPGHYLGSSLEDAVTTIEQVMLAPKVRPAGRAVSRQYRRALEQWRRKRARIEADLLQSLDDRGLDRRRISDANSVIGRDIAAALALGDINYLSREMGPLHPTSSFSRILNSEQRTVYLRAYKDVCRQHLDTHADMILTWFDSLSETHADSEDGATLPNNIRIAPRRVENAYFDDRRNRDDRPGIVPELDSGRSSGNGAHAQSGRSNGRHA